MANLSNKFDCNHVFFTSDCHFDHANIIKYCSRPFETAEEMNRQSFNKKMISRGFSTRVFNPAGQDDIGGGCGQLWYFQDWLKKNKINSYL